MEGSDRRSPGMLAAVLVAVALAVAAAAGVIGWAIGHETAPTAVTVTAGAGTTRGGTTAAPAGRQRGRALYVSAGCASCHGLNAQGTGVGPGLPGHTAVQVHRQVRHPLAQMPAYSAGQLSDEELEAIADYIAGLAPAQMHVEPVQLSNIVEMHHWMAISAIKADDARDALHHVGHIIQAVKGEHLEAMRDAREHLRAGDLHEAEHLIEEMLAGRAKPTLTLQQLHLELALAAIEDANRREALHHIGHFLERARGADRRKGLEIRAHLRAGDLHEAEHSIQHLLELPED